MKKIEIDQIDLEIKESQKQFYKLQLLSQIDGSEISLPFAIIGKGSGKNVTIIAAQHGNEWNGAFTCQMLYQALDPEKMEGRVVLLPIANPPAFNQKSRVSSLDDIDMNRVYGFAKKRKPTEHIASTIFEEFCLKADFVIDLHSGGPGEYVPVVELIEKRRMNEAKSLNLGHLMLRKKDHGSLVPNCEKAGVGAFSIEAGQALDLRHEFAQKITDGILNFLKHVRILKDEPATKEGQKVYEKKIIFPSQISGFFKSSVELLDQVKKRQELCQIWPLFSDNPKKVTSPVDGKIIYLRRERIINNGDSIAHLVT